MGAQKISSKVAKKNLKLNSVMEAVLGSSSDSKFEFRRSPVHAGPANKKSGSSGHKTQAPNSSKSTGKGKSAKAETKGASKAKSLGSSSGTMKKVGGSILSRGLLETSGETVCREVACEGLATSGGYCRLHYIKNWKKIKRKELILRERKLNQYIEELVAKYPDKYIEAIRQDLANDKDFAKVIYDLDLDEGVDDFDVESGDSVDSLIDTIKRDFDDEGDAF
jgi:hypothetical protein